MDPNTESLFDSRLAGLLSAQELADYLEIPLATLYTRRYRNEGPRGFRVGRHLRYRQTDVVAWINSQLEPPTRERTSKKRLR